MLKLSIIVPVFNKVAYIDDCIKSILAQTFTAFELILVNDGSTDGSAEKCLVYAAQDSRVVVVNQQNEGVSSARNAGMALAKGEYIGFVDSDDSIEADMYATLIRIADGADAEISGCRLSMIKDGKKQGAKRQFGLEIYDTAEAVSAHLTGKSDYNLNNKIYRATVLNGLRFEGKMYEDILFVCEAILKANRMIIINVAKYNYTIRDNSASMGTFGPSYLETVAASEKMVNMVAAQQMACLPEAKAFDVMVNLSLLNLMLLLKDRRPYQKAYNETVDKLRRYRSFISSSKDVSIKHKTAILFFSVSPKIYSFCLRIVCRMTESDAIKRTQ